VSDVTVHLANTQMNRAAFQIQPIAATNELRTVSYRRGVVVVVQTIVGADAIPAQCSDALGIQFRIALTIGDSIGVCPPPPAR